MNVPYYVYDTATGAIRWVGFCPQSMVSIQGGDVPGTAAGEGEVDPDTDTINTGTGLPNPPPGTPVPHTVDTATFTADQTTTQVLSAILAGTRMVWDDGVVTLINDGILELRSNVTGTFSGTLQLQGYTSVALSFTGS